MQRTILITGGAGFIGSHVVRLFVTKYPDYRIVNLDKLTYAGNLANLRDIEERPNYTFVRGDICDFEAMRELFRQYGIDGVIHLAAESHVDRSIRDPFTFARTNVMGTLSLLEAAREHWNGNWAGKLFYHISTDEVYGALELTRPAGDPAGGESGGGPFGEEFFTEETKYDPHSPYSASKASSDHFVRAYHDTYGMPTLVTNCSNNYGPYQFPEKLIPLFINNIRHEKPLPVYGRECPRLALRRGPRTGHRRDLPQGQGRRHVQHRWFQRMEEHRPDTGDRQNRGPAAGQSRRRFGKADHVCRRPRGPRPEIRHRLAQTQRRAGLAAQPAVRGGDRKDRPLVPPEPIVDGRHNLRRVPAILSEHV